MLIRERYSILSGYIENNKFKKWQSKQGKLVLQPSSMKLKKKNRINLVCKNQKLVETLEKQNKCNQNN